MYLPKNYKVPTQQDIDEYEKISRTIVWIDSKVTGHEIVLLHLKRLLRTFCEIFHDYVHATNSVSQCRVCKMHHGPGGGYDFPMYSFRNDIFEFRITDSEKDCCCGAYEQDGTHGPQCTFYRTPNFICGDIQIRWGDLIDSCNYRAWMNKPLSNKEIAEMFGRCKKSLGIPKRYIPPER